MKYFRRSLLAIIYIAAMAAFVYQFGFRHRHHAPELPGSVVKVVLDGGHGSGVHIGNGFILTAGHVTEDQTEVGIKADDGTEGRADVIWTAKEYDISLIHTDVKLKTSPIDCRVLPVGADVHAIGNPIDQEFISTWGKVGGTRALGPPWKSAIVVDMTIAPGMSGGALLDQSGDLVGILVGVMTGGNHLAPSLISISYVVPMSGICGIIGRH
jgi:S1-C subfamily serine protease